jgi:hypothetical protein
VNVGQLIAILQTRDPLTEVMLRDTCNDIGYVRARDTESLTLRAYSRKGMAFYGSWDGDEADWPGYEAGQYVVWGVLIE